MVRRNDVQQFSLFDGQGEERTLPVPEQTNEDVQPKDHHIHIEVRSVEGSRAILCTAKPLDPEVLQRPTTEVCFVGGVSTPSACPICHPGQANRATAKALTLDSLTVFSRVSCAYKSAQDRARRVWLRIWAETHDCPEEHLMYSESGYYQVPFWPVGKQQLLYRIKHGSGLLIYSLFVHCLGLRLESCLRDAIVRGEIKDPSECDGGEEEEDF